jgi:hypothetical protein
MARSPNGGLRQNENPIAGRAPELHGKSKVIRRLPITFYTLI